MTVYHIHKTLLQKNYLKVLNHRYAIENRQS